MADEQRQRKVADRIQQTVAQLLERRIKDPRLGFVTITDVRVTGDLQHATIFYTVYGSEDEAAGTAKALRSARGLIRSEVGKALGIRLTPTLEFQLDSLPQSAGWRNWPPTPSTPAMPTRIGAKSWKMTRTKGTFPGDLTANTGRATPRPDGAARANYRRGRPAGGG